MENEEKSDLNSLKKEVNMNGFNDDNINYNEMSKQIKNRLNSYIMDIYGFNNFNINDIKMIDLSNFKDYNINNFDENKLYHEILVESDSIWDLINCKQFIYGIHYLKLHPMNALKINIYSELFHVIMAQADNVNSYSIKQFLR